HPLGAADVARDGGGVAVPGHDLDDRCHLPGAGDHSGVGPDRHRPGGGHRWGRQREHHHAVVVDLLHHVDHGRAGDDPVDHAVGGGDIHVVVHLDDLVDV